MQENVRINFSKSRENITKELLFQKFSDEDIFRYYIGSQFKIGGSIQSPLRSDDDTPSFSIYMSKSGLRFKDFKYDDLRGDCIALVCLLHKISYKEALETINSDMSNSIPNPFKTVVTGFGRNLIGPNPAVLNKTYPIVISQQPYTSTDIYIWKNWGVCIETLNKFDILSCEQVYYGCNIEPSRYTSLNPIYAYRHKTDLKSLFMIYQPMAAKKNKFRQNLTRDVTFGYNQLPSKGDLLILTKSMKDVAAFHDLGHNAIASRSETELISPQLLSSAMQRFSTIITCFDPDDTGIALRNRYVNEYNFKWFMFEERYKDCSGMTFATTKETTAKYVKQQINLLLHV